MINSAKSGAALSIPQRRPRVSLALNPGYSSLPDKLRRASSREAAEGCPRHQAGPTGIIVEEQPAHHFACGVEARDDPAIEILDLALFRNLEAAEREGHAGGHVIGVKRWGIERIGPVGLVDGEAAGPASVQHMGIERRVAAAGGVEIP